jgi:HK97 family phage portal protein
MAWWPWRRNFPTSAPPDVLIAEAVAQRLRNVDVEKLPTVVAGRKLIADTLAMMPMVAVEEATGRRITPTPSVLRRPDPAEPRRATLEQLTNSMTAVDGGTAWLRIYKMGADGWPLAVRYLDHRRVSVQLTADQSEIATVFLDGVEVNRNAVQWIPATLDPGPLGRSPLTDVQETLELMIAVLDWSASYYQDGGPVPYALRNPVQLGDVKSKEFLEQWIEARRLRRPALLSGQWSLESFNLPSAVDAMLIEALNYLDAAAGRALLIPPSLLNVTSQSALTYATVVDELRRWLILGLYPGYLARLEAGFSDLLPRGQIALFDTSNLLRMDLAARITTWATSIAAGIHTPAEVRALEGLPVTPDPDPVSIQPAIEGL